MDDNIVEWIKALGPIVIAIVGFGIGLWQYWAARRRQLLIDIQAGDKSTVAFVAMQLWNGDYLEPKRRSKLLNRIRREKRNTRRRKELFQALCLAAVFQRSGRSMSLIHAALASVIARDIGYRKELREIVDRATIAITRSAGFTDLESGRRRLNSLRTALGLDGELRLRLDAYELLACPPEPKLGPSPPQAALTFIIDLREAVKKLGSLVVVVPLQLADDEKCVDAAAVDRLNGKGRNLEELVPVVSLSFERAGADAAPAEESSSATIEPATVQPATVQPAKHRVPDELTVENLPVLAGRLVNAIDMIPSYKRATVIATVQGTFSSQLGCEVQKRSKERTHVKLDFSRTSDPVVEVERLNAGDSAIVLDDVYRSGATMQAALKVLRDKNVTPLGGLTAICTVSPLGSSTGEGASPVHAET